MTELDAERGFTNDRISNWYKKQDGVTDAYLSADAQNIFIEDITGITTLFITSSPHHASLESTSFVSSELDKKLQSLYSDFSLQTSITGIKALVMDPIN